VTTCFQQRWSPNYCNTANS